jgi:hypothetical protein
MISRRNLSFDLRRFVKSDSRDRSIPSHGPSYSIRARPCRLHEDERVYYKMMFVPKCSGTMCERERNEKSAAIIIGGMRCSRERHAYVRDGASGRRPRQTPFHLVLISTSVLTSSTGRWRPDCLRSLALVGLVDGVKDWSDPKPGLVSEPDTERML